MPPRKNACLHILAEEIQTKTLHFGFDLHLHIFAFVGSDLILLASMSGDDEGFVRFSSQNLPTDAKIGTLTINKSTSCGDGDGQHPTLRMLAKELGCGTRGTVSVLKG